MELFCHYWPKTEPDAAPLRTNKARLLLLHGLGGTGSLWRPIAASLEESVQILAPDQRGHGRSQNRALTSYSPAEFGQDVNETLEKQGFLPTVGVGHSMGARTLVSAAEQRPDYFSALVLVDLGLSGLAGGGFGTGLSKFLALLPSEFETREKAKDFIQKECPDPAIGQYLMAVSVRHPDGRVNFPFDHQALISTLKGAKTHSIREPLLHLAEKGKEIYILRGAQSRVWTHEEFLQEKTNFQGLSSAHFLEFENAGHGLPFEQRTAFTDLLRKILAL
ncbi:MAG: alpha/beta hydrolase [Bdellovibrio sp.]|nr:alpha/beta hydrolase [Bdellovibrio sp.]